MLDDFEVPTDSNRIIQRNDELFLVMISVGRGVKANFKSKAVQNELKQIICLMLDEDDEEEQENVPAPIRGKKMKVTLKKRSGAQVAEVFSFHRDNNDLYMRKWVYHFTIED